MILSIQVQRKAWKHSKHPNQLIPELLTVLRKEKTNCMTTAKEWIKKNMKTWVKLRQAEAQEEAQPARGQDSNACLSSTYLLVILIF